MDRVRINWAAWVLLSVAVLGSHAQDAASAAGVAGEVGAIKVTAKKYEFNPSVISVKKGEEVRLVITAVDRDHGFKLEAFNINQKLKKGEAVTIEFTADRPGTFPFQCSRFCGLGHGKMKGKLVVEEALNR